MKSSVRKTGFQRILCVLIMLAMTGLCSADTLKVLIVGSTSDLGDKYASDSAAFSPAKIATELDNIITQNGPGNATVTVAERFNNNLPTGFVYNTATFPSDSYNLTGWFHFPLPAGSESNRWANLRGAAGTAWDYVVIIGDPYTMEKTPGMYAQGVAVVAEEVAKGTAEPILLMNWPAGTSSSSVDHYKEVVYRAGRSGGYKVAPAALAWQAAGSPTGGTHPSDDGAYIAAASIYSRIYNQSASNSGYTYNDTLADTVHTAVTNHVGQPQYAGTFSFTNPYLMLGDTRRDVHFSEKGSSTEEDFKNAAKAAMDRCRVTYNTIDYCPNGSSSSATYNSNTPEDDGLGWPSGNSMPIAWNHGRSFPDGKKWVLNTNYWQLGFGYEYQWNTTAYSDEIANDHYIAMMDYYDTLRANQMLPDTGVGARWIPTRMLWAQMHREYPALDPMRDSNHLNWDQTHAIGTFMYTLYSGRCPLDPEPSPMTSRWMAQKIGYETAWRMGRCQTRAPGFKVLPSSATATDVTPVIAETLSVQFIMAPLSNVTVTVTTDDRLKGKVSPSRLTFTPANYQVAQTVTVLGETGGAGSFEFDVLLTTSSGDPVYDGLSDAWTYVNTRPEGPVPPDIQILGNGIPIETGDTTPDIADGTDFGAATAPVTRAFTITNLSDSATLTLSDSPRVTLTSGSGNFTLTQDAATGSIAPLGSTPFEITYDAAGGVHTAQVSVASSDANLPTYTFEIKGFSPGVPTVTNQGATSGQLTATLEGQLSDGGTADAIIYWGTTDGGTTPGNWDNAVPIAAVTQGNNFSTELTGLVAGRQYYYRSYATNSEGSDWADSTELFMTAVPPALPVTMVRWGAPGREDVVSANTSKSATGTYDPATPRSPTIGGAAGYYVTDSSNRTPVIYGAHQGLLEIRESGSADYAWLAKYMSIGDTMKAMFVWKKADFLTDRSAIVTDFKLVMGGPTSLAYTNRWVVEKAGQFYISDQTFTTGTFDVDVSSLTWREYTPLNSGSDTIGAAATVTLYDLDSVGFYLNVERLTGDPGWQRPTFDYFAVDGDEDPDLSATVNYVTYVAGTGGSITGTATQEVVYGQSTTPVTATPAAYYSFTAWSDGSTANPRSDANVTSGQTYTANFAAAVTATNAVPHAWLAAQDPSWTSGFEALQATDHDGDGVTTGDEYWAGTDPNNKESVLGLVISVENGVLTLEWSQHNPAAELPDLRLESSTDLRSTPWDLIEEIQRTDGVMTWTKSDPLPGAENRTFYRLGAQTVYSEIVGVQRVDLKVGRNFVGVPFNTDSNTVEEIFGMNQLPSGPDEAQAATVEEWVQSTQSLGERYWISDAAPPFDGWLNGFAQAGDTVLDVNKGYVVTLRSHRSPTTIYVAGKVPTEEQVQVLDKNGFSLVNSHFPVPVSLADSELVESGLQGGSSVFSSDNVLFHNPSTGMFDHLAWYDTTTSTWRNSDETVATRSLQPGEAFIVWRRNRPADVTWTNPVPYTLP